MLTIPIGAGPTARYCDGVSRRSFLKVGVAGMAGVGLADVLRAREVSGDGKKTSVILIWLDGGPSHMDLYDLKPEAPAEYRGIWKPIKTNVPGIEISELFPRQARVADKFSIVRSLRHGTGDHFTAADFMLSGRGAANGADTTARYPSVGSIAAAVCGSRRPGVPPYIAVPYAASVGIRPGYFGANYIGVQHNPFETEGDPNGASFQVRDVNLAPGLTVPRLDDRRRLLASLDSLRRRVESDTRFDAIDRFERAAYEIVSGPLARKAFDIAQEDPRVRDLYGRHSWGQSALLARRLVEAGSTFVTVHLGGWDHHWDLKQGMENLLPIVDRMVAGLFEDLVSRGLLDDVLVVLCGEFSRTPRMNDGSGRGTPGRDHWGNAMFCLMGGGGVQGGRIVGSTNRLGEEPKDRPVCVGDIHATIYQVLGVDPSVTFLSPAGRPTAAVEKGAAIDELF